MRSAAWAAVRVSSSLMPAPARARDAEAALVVLGRARQRDLDGQARARHVRAQRVLHLDDVRRRLDAGEVAELADLLDVVEHLGQLLAHALDLVLGELEAGEPGDVEHLVTAQHRRAVYETPARATARARPQLTAGPTVSAWSGILPSSPITGPSSPSAPNEAGVERERLLEPGSGS